MTHFEPDDDLVWTAAMNRSCQVNAWSIKDNIQQWSENNMSLAVGEEESTFIGQIDFWITVITDTHVILVGGLVGIPGNVLTAVILYRQGLRQRINLCFFSLALLDLLALLTNVVDHGERLYKLFVKSPAFIWVYAIGLKGAVNASQFLSAVIAAERCFCVVSPFHAKRLLKTSTMAAIIVVCSILLIGGTAGTIGLKFATGWILDPMTNLMTVNISVTTYYLKNRVIIDTIDIFFYGIGLPGALLIVVIVTTSITIVKVRAALGWRQQATMLENQSNFVMSSKDVSVTFMQIVQSAMFVVYMTPTLAAQICFYLVSDLSPIEKYSPLSNILWNIVHFLAICQLSITIVVFYKSGRKFRESLRKILRKTR